MFKVKFSFISVLIFLSIFISNIGFAEEQQYSEEEIVNCLKLSEEIDTNSWVIDENLSKIDDSNLEALDDGWNKLIKAAHENMLKVCSTNKESDECWSAKQPERKLKNKRKKCYHGLLMKNIKR